MDIQTGSRDRGDIHSREFVAAMALAKTSLTLPLLIGAILLGLLTYTSNQVQVGFIKAQCSKFMYNSKYTFYLIYSTVSDTLSTFW